ncbi:hypothetical protein PUN28_005778 [Cardiocondyla obscurior]|uniref:Uncharacterized protein n=1 Tax=Cardiocondyla obscurior TaxID=286306 RepID=A0AAW2GBN5_9HYME
MTRRSIAIYCRVEVRHLIEGICATRKHPVVTCRRKIVIPPHGGNNVAETRNTIADHRSLFNCLTHPRVDLAKLFRPNFIIGIVILFFHGRRFCRIFPPAYRNIFSPTFVYLLHLAFSSDVACLEMHAICISLASCSCASTLRVLG